MNSDWHEPPDRLELPEGVVHVWRSHLGLNPALLNKISECLSEEENVRADRFVNVTHQHQFRAAHGILRYILASYLQQDPGRLRFRYGPNGKPYLEESINKLNIRFNMSHSNDIVVYGIIVGVEVGIDVECLRSNVEVEDIAKRFFSKIEYEQLMKLSPADRINGFYRCWTRKEAFIKALGKGLSHPLDSFNVSLASDSVDFLVFSSDQGSHEIEWSVYTLFEDQKTVAALAHEGKINQLYGWQWKAPNNII